MLLDQFPDINWLREQAKNNFQNSKGINNLSLQEQGWPSVVLNTTSYGAERNSIKAPFSLFLNLSGKSIVKASGKSIELTSDNLCTVNKGGFYDLIIPEDTRTDTFNIHFGDQLYSDVLKVFNNSANELLDSPFGKDHSSHQLNMKSTWKDGRINQHIQALRKYYQQPQGSRDHEYELLGELLFTMLEYCKNDRLQHHQISSLKTATKKELLNRITLSVDFMHAHYKEAINLDELAAIACLSKYHYLRTFKSIYGYTPQQMIAKLRYEKAISLLKDSTTPIMEIAPSLGFSELAAFTRFFTKHAGLSPKAFRINN